MLLYVSFDGDGIGQMVGRARLDDNVEEVRRVNQRIELGNKIWESFALRVGGNIVELGGDEGALEIPADSLDELPAIAQQYGEKVGATVSVGVGTKLSESSKALLHAKLTGKDKIDFYTDEMEGVLAEAQKREGTEAEKIAKEYLNKADASGYAGTTRPSAPSVVSPTATQGDHEEGQVLNDTLESSAAPAPPEMTHSARDFERQLHDEAWKGEEEDAAATASKHTNLEQIKQQVVQALQTLKAQAPILEQVKQTAPDAYGAMMGLAQAVIGMAKELAPQPLNKAETRYCMACKDPLDKNGHCKVKAHWEKLDKEELEKIKLPMPKVAAHHHVTLPSGSFISKPRVGAADSGLSDNAIKVTHQDGNTSIKQVSAGMITSTDPASHAVSSRAPNSK